MAKSVNKVFLLGNVGKDPEIRTTPSGMMVGTFSLATTDRQKDPQGNWQDRTEWHNLVTFGRTAEIVRDYVKKGNKLFVEGKIQTRSWDDEKTQQKRYRTEIIVNDLSLLSGREEGAAGTAAPALPRPASTSASLPVQTSCRSPPKSRTTISRSRACLVSPPLVPALNNRAA